MRRNHGRLSFKRPVAPEVTVLTAPITHWETRPLAYADLSHLLRLLFEPAEADAAFEVAA